MFILFPRLHVSLEFCLSYLVFLFSPSCAVSPVYFSGLCLQPNSVYFIVPLNQALWSPRDAATFQTALGMFPLSSSCKPIEPCSSPWAYHNLDLAGISYLFNEISIPHNIIRHIHLPFHSVTLFFQHFLSPAPVSVIKVTCWHTRKVLGHCSSWKTSLS